MFELVFLGVVFLGVVWSYALALEKGVPWFDWNGQKRVQQRRQVRSPKTSSLEREKSFQFRRPVAQTSYSSLFGRLNELTRNREITGRLIQHVSHRHPDKTAEWCVEKAIYDLERDRMAR